MNEYASRFHVLLKYSSMHDAQDRLEEIQIASLPNYKDEKDVRKVINRYQQQASGIKDKPDNKPFKSQLRKKPR